jgi:uncharacterized repeat protein (TIGR04042 family)
MPTATARGFLQDPGPHPSVFIVPEVHLRLEWPDGRTTALYSPSTVILDYLRPGERLSVRELRARASEALRLASERVRARYGFACTRADEEESRLLHTTTAYGDDQLVGIACP